MKQNFYDGKVFAAVANSENGEVSGKTKFFYHQTGDIVWAEYSGGEIVKGFLVGKADSEGRLTFSYQHINIDSEIRIGMCNSFPEQPDGGKLRLNETWQWLNGDKSTGTSIIEEVAG